MKVDSVPLFVNDLRKSYVRKGREPFLAVDGVGFQIAKGECFGLLGPNGAGKSTTMKCVTGFYRPTSGYVEILGINVHEQPKKARQFLGVCAQDDTLDSDFNVIDQLTQYGLYFGIRKPEARLRAEALLDRFGLSDKKGELVEALSGGMRRRLQVARGLINEPQVFVLDEPTTGLDPEARRTLWDVLLEQRKKGLAILLSTHYMDEAERLCDRVAIIHNGNILKCDSPQSLIQTQIGAESISEEIRPGLVIQRNPNLEDVYLKITGNSLQSEMK